jgi:hypothetical protein
LKLEQQSVYGWCLRLTRNVSSSPVSIWRPRKLDPFVGRKDILYAVWKSSD